MGRFHNNINRAQQLLVIVVNIGFFSNNKKNPIVAMCVFSADLHEPLQKVPKINLAPPLRPPIGTYIKMAMKSLLEL